MLAEGPQTSVDPTCTRVSWPEGATQILVDLNSFFEEGQNTSTTLHGANITCSYIGTGSSVPLTFLFSLFLSLSLDTWWLAFLKDCTYHITWPQSCWKWESSGHSCNLPAVWLYGTGPIAHPMMNKTMMIWSTNHTFFVFLALSFLTLGDWPSL